MLGRVRAPLGGAAGFVLVAGLVLGGLGWVTVAALRVEAAQREAAAEAKLESKTRIALWRLDGSMLPALGLEDSRPFHHYAAVHAPLNAVNDDGEALDLVHVRVPSPLLAGNLPPWMQLHFQIDPDGGWSSPQVPPDALKNRLTATWGAVPMTCTPERADRLGELREKYPAGRVVATLAQWDRATPPDSPPLAGHIFQDAAPTPDPLAEPPPAPTPAAEVQAPTPPRSDIVRVLGFDIPADNRVTLNPWAPAEDRFKKEAEALRESRVQRDQPAGDQAAAPPPRPLPPPEQTAGNFRFNDRQMQELNRTEYGKRAAVAQRGSNDIRGAYDNGQFFARNFMQNSLATGNTNPAGLTQQNPVVSNSAYPVPQYAVPGNFQPTNPPAPVTVVSPNPPPASQPAAPPILPTPAPTGAPAGPATMPAPARPAAPGPAAVLADPSPMPPAAVPPPPHVPDPAPSPAIAVHLGAMRPQWLTAADGSEVLVLVRAARLETKTVYQGVLLDWPRIRADLKDAVSDLFPDARLVPVKQPVAPQGEVSPERVMTALPVQLDTGPGPGPPPAGWTPLRFGLVLAWVATVVALGAVGLGGWSLIDLSERRIRFVSAVTHELRTPLTSLRLYLDLLSSGLVTDADKQKEYLHTLTAESDRLHRLVNNVLDFARLERRRTTADRKPVKLAEILFGVRDAWAERCAADGKELLVISTLPADQELCTDSQLVQQIVSNLVDNARKYTRDADDRRIWVWARPCGKKWLALEVEDRGCGVAGRERGSIFRPFRRGAAADTKAGGAGLGLALARQWAAAVGGRLTFRPADGGVGACFRLELPAKCLPV